MQSQIHSFSKYMLATSYSLGPVLGTPCEDKREGSQKGLTEAHCLLATKLHVHIFTFCLGNPASRNLLNYQTKAKVEPHKEAPSH